MAYPALARRLLRAGLQAEWRHEVCYERQEDVLLRVERYEARVWSRFRNYDLSFQAARPVGHDAGVYSLRIPGLTIHEAAGGGLEGFYQAIR